MATQPERIAALEDFRKSHSTTFYWVLGGLAAWLATITIWLFTMKGDVQAIKQRVADGGTATIVSELKSDTHLESTVGKLNIIQGNIQLAAARHSPPDQEKLKQIVSAVVDSAKRFPLSAAPWQTVATLASYRTADLIKNALVRPACDINQVPHTIDPSEVPSNAMHFGNSIGIGFVFKNCTLRMDHLPPGHLVTTTTTAAVNIGDHIIPAGTKITGSYFAYLIDCDVVLGNSGIADSPIVAFWLIDCRQQYYFEGVPPPQTQRFLLASVNADNPGMFDFKTNPS